MVLRAVSARGRDGRFGWRWPVRAARRSGRVSAAKETCEVAARVKRLILLTQLFARLLSSHCWNSSGPPSNNLPCSAEI